MTLHVRNAGDSVRYAMVAAFNATRVGMVGTNPHVDTTTKDTTTDFSHPSSTPDVPSTVSAPADLAHVISLYNECVGIYGRHIADTFAHKAADTTNTAPALLASTALQAAVDTALNAFKALINLHFLQAGVHYTNDSTNTITAADATDLASSKTLIADIASDLNDHVLFAVGGDSIDLGPA